MQEHSTLEEMETAAVLYVLVHMLHHMPHLICHISYATSYDASHATGMKGAFATRMAGSGDLYARNNRRPSHSINFVIAHDGFSLADLVSYNSKHNQVCECHMITATSRCYLGFAVGHA
jgi:hypothetical protein